MAARRGLQGTRPPRSSRRSIAGRRRIRCRGSRPLGASYPWRVRLFRRNLTEWEVRHGPMTIPRPLRPLDSGFRRNDEGGHGPMRILRPLRHPSTFRHAQGTQVQGSVSTGWTLSLQRAGDRTARRCAHGRPGRIVWAALETLTRQSPDEGSFSS